MKIRAKIRTLSHLIFKSGNIFIGLDHFLVAFPSILLMAKMLDEYKFSSNSISLLLFSTGFCNLILYKVTGCKIPIFVAPSFAFIRFIKTTMESDCETEAHSMVFIGFLVASFLFLFIAILYLFPKIRKYIKLTLPDALVGPMISLIGLDLLDTAIGGSGLLMDNPNWNVIIVALVTLSVIVICTTFKRSFLKNASVVIGVIVGLALSGVLLCYQPNFGDNIFCNPIMASAELASKTNISSIDFEQIDLLNIFIAIIPATIVVFSENITKITLLEKMIRAEKKEKTKEAAEEVIGESADEYDLADFYERSIWGHAVSFILSVIMRSVPNTVYAQNIALMEIHNVENYNNIKVEKEQGNNIAKYYERLSVYPLGIASIFLIICSFFTFFQNNLSDIPKPVYGGMELFVFSIISAQGVQLVVDRKVNYKKITNQIITSATLLAGLSGVSIDLNVAEISGLSLGFLVGVSLNLFFRICSYFGLINEKLNVIDVLETCDSVFHKEYNISVGPENIDRKELNEYIEGKNRTEPILDLVNGIKEAEIKIGDKTIKIIEENENIVLEVAPYLETYKAIRNDYARNVKKKDDSLIIIFDEKFSLHKLKSSLQRI